MPGGLRDWLTHRLGLDAVRREVLDRRVAKGAWYMGDGAALTMLLGMQIVTGMALALGYSAAPQTALQSVLHITHEQFLGSFVRALHYWSGGLMVAVVVWHLLRQILVGGYKAPREGTWLVGVALFFLVWIMSLTGYVLRWDQVGLGGLRVALTLFSRVPLIGDGLVRFVLGGPEIGAATLSRIFSAHVVIIPLAILGLVAHHLYLVIYHGTTAPTEREGVPIDDAEEQQDVYEADAHTSEKGEHFFPGTMASSGAFAMVVLALALGLALFLGPPDLQEPAMSIPEAPFPAEEWWYSWFSGMIGLLPPWIAWWFPVALVAALAGGLVALPLVDRFRRRGILSRPVAVVGVILVAITLFLLSDVRRRSQWTAFPRSEPVILPEAAVLSEGAQRGHALFTTMGCTSCHAIDGSGGKFAPDLTEPSTNYSYAMLVDYITQPPPDVAMPAYGERATDAEIAAVAEFVLAIQTMRGGRP